MSATANAARRRFPAKLAIALGLSTLLPSFARAQGTNPPPGAPVPIGAEIVVPPGRTAAQEAAKGMGHSVSNEQIAEAIRRSGLTQEQIRARLQQSGRDPSLADAFFGVGTVPSPAVAASLAGAMQDIGLMSADDSTAAED